MATAQSAQATSNKKSFMFASITIVTCWDVRRKNRNQDSLPDDGYRNDISEL